MGNLPTEKEGTKSFSLSCEDTQVKDDWRLRIKRISGIIGEPRFTWKIVESSIASETQCNLCIDLFDTELILGLSLL